ncbi:MAG TPA: OpgC domain-containing protein [Candidatus Limnocylindria bacterium]|nr:OpgC domain-containing protein [Candidatus Limnocylindria bacterium]
MCVLRSRLHEVVREGTAPVPREGRRLGGRTEALNAATKRDLRLDLLRGFCVVVMVADHIGGESSWLYVLISGITMGMVYRGVIDRDEDDIGVTVRLRAEQA